ncbi:hypothetical protein L218DRAFT_179369 [Marasmius fiardii PR-910]|nr:hypothetical protein L218DRAFT_179369 [Marasmius fiardii PR-910]
MSHVHDNGSLGGIKVTWCRLNLLAVFLRLRTLQTQPYITMNFSFNPRSLNHPQHQIPTQLHEPRRQNAHSQVPVRFGMGNPFSTPQALYHAMMNGYNPNSGRYDHPAGASVPWNGVPNPARPNGTIHRAIGTIPSSVVPTTAVPTLLPPTPVLFQGGIPPNRYPYPGSAVAPASVPVDVHGNPFVRVGTNPSVPSAVHHVQPEREREREREVEPNLDSERTLKRKREDPTTIDGTLSPESWLCDNCLRRSAVAAESEGRRGRKRWKGKQRKMASRSRF